MSNPLFHQILVPTDGSQSSLQAGQLAFRLAQLCGAQLTALYVVDTAVLEEIARFSEQQRAEVRQELFDNGHQYLAYIDGLAHQTNLTLQQEIREGVPYEEIVALAAAINADLIVMGHVGRRGPRRILIGSVTERVIEFAHCPVLVAKQ
ncbi:MAG TPA: universal stress protein [Caldilineaceae bacterium]|nr:universal stress protein [Caldilineaceae bacterium]